MKKRLLAVLLAAVLMVAAIVPAAAYTPQQQKTADALNELGLFQGMGGAAGYALDQNLTRAQGITLLVRMIGMEETAKEGAFRTPFVDVPTWAAGYVGYAYTNGITNGMGPDKFGSDVQLNDNMFLTLVLRALGYSDVGENAQFVWDNPYELAKKAGLIAVAAADKSFTRADAVDVFWNAMNAEMVGKDMTLAESLVEQEIFTAEEFAAAEEIQKNGRPETEPEQEQEQEPEKEPEQGNTEPAPDRDEPIDGEVNTPDPKPEDEKPSGGNVNYGGPELGETERDY